MRYECVIIGCGVGGLSAANKLADLGISTLIVDAGQLPMHRVCGEFFSAECLPILHSWGIRMPSSIKQASFYHKNNHVDFPLPAPAAGCSRYSFDKALLDRAISKGVKALLGTKVLKLEAAPHGCQIHLEGGKSIQSDHLILATGKIPSLQNSPKLVYTGFKAHFTGIQMDSKLEMYCFPGGYVGVSPISEDVVNVACIAQASAVEAEGGLSGFMDRLQKKESMKPFAKRLAPGKMLFEEWMQAKVPAFGLRAQTAFPNALWVGDASGSIPPICGEGLSIGITSGFMAAESIAARQIGSFKARWDKRYRKRFYWGNILHHIVMNPYLCPAAQRGCRLFSSIPKLFYELTREKAAKDR